MAESEELIRSWPSLKKASADKVLASPAWRMDVAFARMRDRLTIGGIGCASEEEIYLKIALEGKNHILGVGDSPLYADLHALWSRKHHLDKNIVLALVEKECGALFVLIEHVFGADLVVKGILDKLPDGTRTAFRTSNLAFSLDLTSEMRLQLADLSYLDAKHDAIRSMTRSARADYAKVELDERAIMGLGEGDVIPLGIGYLSSANWNLEGFAAEETHIVASEARELRFADFADETLPAIEPSDSLLLVKGDSTIAEGELFDLGGIPCFKLTRMHS